MVEPLRGGGRGVKGLPLRKKELPPAIKMKGGGGYALMAQPLRKFFFFYFCGVEILIPYSPPYILPFPLNELIIRPII